MTECERIIKERILPNSFFDEEVICDFFVSRERKKIWAINIDLLIKFDTICRKHKLHYSIAFGSLLGMVRHNGFIPWDDDIDVVMPRADYEKLKDFKADFDGQYFLQYPGEDKGYYYSFAKLRNSNTSGISIPFRYEDFNQGIFMDIFPMDNFYEYGVEDNIERIKNLISEGSALMRSSNPYPDSNDLKKLLYFSTIREGKTITEDLTGVLCQFNSQPSEEYVVWCCPIYDYKRMLFPKVFFDDLIEVSFYGHLIYAPRQYDKVLAITYGNYLELPPVEKRGKWHNNSVFNPDVPYGEMIQLLREKDLKKE